MNKLANNLISESDLNIRIGKNYNYQRPNQALDNRTPVEVVKNR